MGWLFCEDTKEDLVKHILRDIKTAKNCEMLDHSVNGDALFILIHHIPKDMKVILVYKMQGTSASERRRGYSGPWWGYKDMDESMGPSTTGLCPKRILMASTCVDKDAVAWRASQLAQHDMKRDTARIAKTMESGWYCFPDASGAWWEAYGYKLPDGRFALRYDRKEDRWYSPAGFYPIFSRGRPLTAAYGIKRGVTLVTP